MLLVAASLARKYFDSWVPEPIIAAERADPIIERMVGRIVANWQADKPTGPPSIKTVRLDQLQLHDGARRRARHLARTLFWPSPHEVATIPLPRGRSFAYPPIRISRDLVALPLWRAYRQGRAQAGRLLYALVGCELVLAVMPASAQTKLRIKWYQNATAAANRALVADPEDAAAWCKLGDALSVLKRHGEAIAYYDKALALAPSNATTSRKRAAAIRAIGTSG
jgi:tetratricopeptide (TPR) repeat protein